MFARIFEIEIASLFLFRFQSVHFPLTYIDSGYFLALVRVVVVFSQGQPLPLDKNLSVCAQSLTNI